MKLFVSVIVLVLLGLTSAANETEWKCGSSKWSLSLAAANLAVSASCDAQSKDKLNACCGVHDECYGRHDPRKDCDKAICKCMNEATEQASNSYCKGIIPGLFCTAVESLGQSAYDDRIRKAQQLKELQNGTPTAN